MIDCGIDESKQSRTSWLVVSAVIGRTKEMRTLKKHWSQDLGAYGVDYFHAKDHWNLKAPNYHNLGMDDRKILLKKLMKDFQKNVERGFSVYVDEEAYKGFTTPRFRSNFGSAYAFSIQVLYVMIYQYLMSKGRDREGVNVLIEDGHRNARQAFEIAGNAKKKPDPVLNINTYGLGGKEGNPILQAGDLLAFSSCQHIVLGESSMFEQLADLCGNHIAYVKCSEELVDAAKTGIEANLQRLRELRLRAVSVPAVEKS